MNALAGSQMLCFCREILGASKNKYTNEKREITDRLTLLFQQFCRKDVWLDTELKMPVCNTSLLGLICGALPCIIDKQLMCQRLVREMPIKHHLQHRPYIQELHCQNHVLISPANQIPGLLTVLLVAFLDWTDDDTW